MARKARISNRFREYVLDPVPESVTDVKMDQPMRSGGYGYVFSFSISPADFDLIRLSRPFKRGHNLYYRDGFLMWDWDRGTVDSDVEYGFTPYTARREPSWLDLVSWEKADIWALVREDKKAEDTDFQVLIYRRELEQACFFVFHYEEHGVFLQYKRSQVVPAWKT